jgi:hypothetical protein
MTVADSRVIEQLNIMNVQLRNIQVKVSEMSAYMKSIAESLQVLAQKKEGLAQCLK